MIHHDNWGDFDEDVQRIIEICHEQAHEAEDDVEDGLLISLTRQEVWLTMLAWFLLGHSADCLKDDTTRATERLAELMDVQKHHWQRPEGLA